MSDGGESRHLEAMQTRNIVVAPRGSRYRHQPHPLHSDYEIGRLWSYAGPNCIHNISTTTLKAFPSFSNHDLHLGILVEYLLNSAVVPARFSFGSRGILGLFTSILTIPI